METTIVQQEETKKEKTKSTPRPISRRTWKYTGVLSDRKGARGRWETFYITMKMTAEQAHKEIKKRLPQEHLARVGDRRRVPYDYIKCGAPQLRTTVFVLEGPRGGTVYEYHLVPFGKEE